MTSQEHDDGLVIGGGVAGCSTAYYLARAGVRVALLERGRLAGEGRQADAGHKRGLPKAFAEWKAGGRLPES